MRDYAMAPRAPFDVEGYAGVTSRKSSFICALARSDPPAYDDRPTVRSVLIEVPDRIAERSQS